MCKISRLKIKVSQKYPLTWKQVAVTDLSFRLGCVRFSLDDSFLKHHKSRFLLITFEFLRDMGNLCHGFLELFHIGCDSCWTQRRRFNKGFSLLYLLILMLISSWSTLPLRHVNKKLHNGPLIRCSSLQLLLLTRWWGLELAKLVLSWGREIEAAKCLVLFADCWELRTPTCYWIRNSRES
jgi:hypothetical protein